MKKRKCIMKNMETGAEDKNQQTAIYVMTHKAFTPPPDPLYIPLHVGRAAASSYSRDEKSSPLSFCVGDNTGDHISEKNCYYSELTGMYWVWKNSHAKVVGTCHYRRYLLNEQGKLFTEAQILSLLQQYDVITTKELQLNFSYYEGFASHHKILYLDETARESGRRGFLSPENFRIHFGVFTVCLDQAQQAAGVCVYGRHAGRKSRDCRSPVPAGGIF